MSYLFIDGHWRLLQWRQEKQAAGRGCRPRGFVCVVRMSIDAQLEVELPGQRVGSLSLLYL